MIFHCSFGLYFSDDQWCWAMSQILGYLSSLKRCLFRSFAHFKSDYLFSDVELFEFFICSGCWSWQVNSLPTFSQVLRLSFHACFLFCAEVSSILCLQPSLLKRSGTSFLHSFVHHVIQVHTQTSWKGHSPLCLYKSLWIYTYGVVAQCLWAKAHF